MQYQVKLSQIEKTDYGTRKVSELTFLVYSSGLELGSALISRALLRAPKEVSDSILSGESTSELFKSDGGTLSTQDRVSEESVTVVVTSTAKQQPSL